MTKDEFRSIIELTRETNPYTYIGMPEDDSEYGKYEGWSRCCAEILETLDQIQEEVWVNEGYC